MPWYQSAECKCTRVGNGYQEPSACDPVVQSFIAWKADYERQVDAFLAGPFEAAAVETKLAAWSSQIADVVKQSVGAPSARSVSSWQTALQQLRDQIASAREHRGYPY